MGPVAPVLSVASGIFGIVQGIKSYSDAKSAAKDQKKLAKLNAQNIQAQGAEEKRRAALAEGKRAGTNRARMGASGLAPTGSMALWEKEQQDEFKRQMGWLDKSTSSKSGIADKQGDIAASTTEAGGMQDLFGGIGGSVDPIYQGGQGLGWWS